MSLLKLRGVDVHYGDFQALYEIDVTLAESETLAVIGANGAGKSTLLGTIAGVHRPSSGEVLFDGVPVTGEPAHRRVTIGISLTPEGRRIFPSMTVEENLLTGAHTRRAGPWRVDAVYELFPMLADRRAQLGANLSGGEQQAVAIGRSLMANPRLLLLDEVSLGLAPVVVSSLYEALPEIIAAGTSVLVVEQDVKRALAVADRVQCLLEGRTSLESPAADVTRERAVAAYFGIEERTG